LRQVTGEKDTLLLAAAQIGNLPVRVRQHFYLVETFTRDFAVALFWALDETEVTVTTYQHHVHHSDGKIPVHGFALRHVTHAGEIFFTGSPKTFTQPLLNGNIPIAALMSVDLPAPFGPTMPTNRPAGTARSTPHKTGFR
jgi:hypothetical protein